MNGNILEQCGIEWQDPIYVNYVDFRKAFEIVIREKLWVITQEYGIPSMYTKIIRDLLHDQRLSRPAASSRNQFRRDAQVRTNLTLRNPCIVGLLNF